MANIKISELPAAAAGSGTQEFEVNDGGTSKKVTGSQIEAFVKSSLVTSDVTDLTATASELNTLDGITASTAELNTLDGITATTSELNILDGVTATTTQLNNTQFLPSAGPLSNRNLIINGAMQVAQRGTSLGTPSTNNYLLDRFSLSRFGGYPDNVTQSQDSNAPNGFTKSFKMVRNSAHTLTGTQASAFIQVIEGQNMAHLNWGTSSAQSITVSFWVRSNKTGNFPFIMADAGNAYDIGKLYNIGSADTWEYKTITIEGPTSGTFNTDNTIGVYLYWGFGAVDAARTAQGTTWGVSNSASSSKSMVTGASTALATDNGATWQITGVQLEVGDTATPFEHRSYGQELALCQRYLTQFTVLSGGERILIGTVESSTRSRHDMPLATPMRATPTITTNGSPLVYEAASNKGFSNPQITAVNNSLAGLKVDISSGNATNSCMIRFNSASDYIRLDAEL